VESDSESWLLPPGRALWIPAGTYHAIDCRSPVVFRMPYLSAEAELLGPRCLVVRVSALLHAVILRLVEAPERQDQREALESLLHSELGAAPIEPLSLPKPAAGKLKVLAAALLDDPADARGLREWAGHLALSERSLIRLILAETGMTFREWRRRIRMIAALERLQAGKSVTETAFDVGYASSSAFTAAFRRSFGALPRDRLAEAPRVP